MKTICFDFDGVIHSYKSGWEGPTIIKDPPVEGIREELEMLKYEYCYNIKICSTRCSTPEGITAIWRWLINWRIADCIDDVVLAKPPAVVYVDDRGFYFDGKTESLATKVNEFILTRDRL